MVKKYLQHGFRQATPTEGSIVTFTTDFSGEDWFAGTMHGVVASIAFRARVIPISHAIPRQDIRAGAFALWAACGFFPEGTIHVAVVDPGVGSGRRAIGVKTARYTFIGPDNGVLSWALRRERVLEVRELANERLFLPRVSRTFHGRDIFAPVAAHLARGVLFRETGPAIGGFQTLAWPEPSVRAREIQGEIIYFDVYGNAVTNIPGERIRVGAGVRVRRRLIPVGTSYASVAPGRPVAIHGSHDLLEIAVNGGSARQRLELEIGTPVRVA